MYPRIECGKWIEDLDCIFGFFGFICDWKTVKHGCFSEYFFKNHLKSLLSILENYAPDLPCKLQPWFAIKTLIRCELNLAYWLYLRPAHLKKRSPRSRVIPYSFNIWRRSRRRTRKKNLVHTNESSSRSLSESRSISISLFRTSIVLQSSYSEQRQRKGLVSTENSVFHHSRDFQNESLS